MDLSVGLDKIDPCGQGFFFHLIIMHNSNTIARITTRANTLMNAIIPRQKKMFLFCYERDCPSQKKNGMT